MYFSAQLLLLDMIFLTLSRKPGKNLVNALSFVYIFYDLSLSTRLIKLLRFKLNQITRKRSGSTRLTTLLRWEIFILPTRKPWLNQAYHASDVEIVNQISQKTLVKPGLPGFWGGKFQPGLPGKPGNTRLTKHFWLRFLSRDLSYQTFVVNYNLAIIQDNKEILGLPWKPGKTRLSVLVDSCQKPGKSGSTRVYQAHQAFNQTFGARAEIHTVVVFLCVLASSWNSPGAYVRNIASVGSSGWKQATALEVSRRKKNLVASFVTRAEAFFFGGGGGKKLA